MAGKSEIAIYRSQIQEHKRKYLNRANNHWQVKLNEVAKILSGQSGLLILDLGCGVGTFALEYGKKGNTTIGVDYCLEILKEGHKVKIEEDSNGANFINSKCEQLPFRDNCFDVIIASDIIEHLVRPLLKKTYQECFRVLKDEGLFIIHSFPARLSYYHIGELINKHIRRNPVPHYNYQTKQSIGRELKQAGFKILNLFSADVHQSLKPPSIFRRWLSEHLFPKADIYCLCQKPLTSH